jgi:hypothetical protein
MAITTGIKVGDDRAVVFGTDADFKWVFNTVTSKFELVNAANSVLASVTTGGVLAAVGLSGPFDGTVGAGTPSTIAGTTGTFSGDIACNGGDFTSTATTFNFLAAAVTTFVGLNVATAITLGKDNTTTMTLKAGTIATGQTSLTFANTTATTVAAFGAATTFGMGATTGTLTLNNPTVVGSQTTVNLWNTTSTTVNFAGAATTVSIGKDATTTINLKAATIASGLNALTLFNTSALTVTAFGAATALTFGAATGTCTINNAAIKMPNMPTANTGANGGMWVDSSADYAVKMGHA